MVHAGIPMAWPLSPNVSTPDWPVTKVSSAIWLFWIMKDIGNPLAPARFIASQNSPLLLHPSPTGARWKRSTESLDAARATPVVVALAIGRGAVGGIIPLSQLPMWRSLPPAPSCPPSM